MTEIPLCSYHPMIGAAIVGSVSTAATAVAQSPDWRLIAVNGAITLAATALAGWLRKTSRRTTRRKNHKTKSPDNGAPKP